MLKELHWLSVVHCAHFKVLDCLPCLAWHHVTWQTSLIQFYWLGRALRSATGGPMLQEPRTCHTRADQAFSKADAVLWNSFPLNIRSAPSVTQPSRNTWKHTYSNVPMTVDLHIIDSCDMFVFLTWTLLHWLCKTPWAVLDLLALLKTCILILYYYYTTAPSKDDVMMMRQITIAMMTMMTTTMMMMTQIWNSPSEPV